MDYPKTNMRHGGTLIVWACHFIPFTLARMVAFYFGNKNLTSPNVRNANHLDMSRLDGDNLPGWMVTKRFFVMLSLIIPEKQFVTSTNIDVYLEPFEDELLVLWDGVPTVDMSESPKLSNFTSRAILMWTIQYYPGYGLISGCATKGYQGCPICGPNADSRFSKRLKKMIFQGHRRYLPTNHPFWFMPQAFNGKEHRQ